MSQVTHYVKVQLYSAVEDQGAHTIPCDCINWRIEHNNIWITRDNSLSPRQEGRAEQRHRQCLETAAAVVCVATKQRVAPNAVVQCLHAPPPTHIHLLHSVCLDYFNIVGLCGVSLLAHDIRDTCGPSLCPSHLYSPPLAPPFPSL